MKSKAKSEKARNSESYYKKRNALRGDKERSDSQTNETPGISGGFHYFLLRSERYAVIAANTIPAISARVAFASLRNAASVKTPFAFDQAACGAYQTEASTSENDLKLTHSGVTERIPRTIFKASARVTESSGRNVPSEYPETAQSSRAVFTYGKAQKPDGTSEKWDALSDESVFPEATNAIFSISARVTESSGRKFAEEVDTSPLAFTKATASTNGWDSGTSWNGRSAGRDGSTTGFTDGSSFGFGAVFGRPDTASRYTSGFTVYFRAFSIPSPRFTASMNQSPASLASPMVNGQYGWNGASERSI